MNKMESKMPKVSVIISAFNHEKYIADSINSVLNQTYQDFEIIVINDGSSDKTEKVIQDIADKNSDKITFINHNINQRPKLSGNQGLRVAKGEYIAWNDGDDIWYPTKLEKQMEVFLEKHEEKIGIIYCYGEHIIENKARFREKNNAVGLEEDIFKQLYRGAFFFKSSMAVRKEVYDTIGTHDERYPYCTDYEWMIRAAAEGYRFDCVPEVLSKRRIHASNDTIDRSIASNNTKEMLIDISERYKELIKSKNIDVVKRLAICDLQSAQHYFIDGQIAECRKLMFSIIKTRYKLIIFNKRYLAYFLLCCSPAKLSKLLRNVRPFNKLFLAS